MAKNSLIVEVTFKHDTISDCSKITAAWFLFSVLLTTHLRKVLQNLVNCIYTYKKRKELKEYLVQQLDVPKNSCSNISGKMTVLSYINGCGYLTTFHNHNIPAYLIFR